MKYIYTVLIVLFSISIVNAQERYLSEVTDSISIYTYTYSQKAGQNLDLDVYKPIENKIYEYPVVLFVHGGGFMGGSRNDERAVNFCSNLAKSGFVAVSIDYRLLRKNTDTGFGCECPVEDKLAAIGAAVTDLNDATNFLIEHKNDLSIDPDKIVLCGSSAGAETVLSIVYNSSMYGIPYKKYAGVISLAGAIVNSSSITKENAIPTMLFHGTNDDLVPYGIAPHHYCTSNSPGFLMLYGAKAISDKLKSLDKPYWLYTINDANHSVSSTPMTEQLNEIKMFCDDFVLQQHSKQISTVILNENSK